MRERRIYVVGPGGDAAQGGMGRMIAYFVGAWSDQRRHPRLVVIDSYGRGSLWRRGLHFLGVLGRLAGDAARGRIELLHIHVAERGSLLRKGAVVWLGALFGIPTVLHTHGAEFALEHERMGPRLRRLVDATFRRADRVVVLGTPWAAFYRDRVGVLPERLRIIWNAVPNHGYVPRPAQEPVKLLFLGRLGDRKGVPELLRALASRPLIDRPWRAVLAGDGEIERFRREAALLGLSGRIEFPGWVEAEVAGGLMVEADLLVLPSHNEGLPMAILEALSRGLPVVATTVGAVQDAVSDGVEGFLVPPGDVPALAAAIDRLVCDPALRSELGRRARARFENRFEIGAYLANLGSVFAELGVPVELAGPLEASVSLGQPQ